MRLAGLLLVTLFCINILAIPARAATLTLVVNGQTITDTDIEQRARFLRLERKGKSNADRRRLAEEELINDAVKLTEAQRLGIEIDETAVDETYTRVAVNAKLGVAKLNEILAAAGVQPKTLKDRLRAMHAWQAVVGNQLRSKVKISDIELDLAAREQLTDTISYDYMLTEVRFLSSDGSSVKSRIAQANQYRRNFTGCENAVDLSLSYRDAAVRPTGRRHSTQLSDAVARELAQLNVGQISKPRVVSNGVQMLAICEKAEAEDLSYVKSKLRNDVGSEKLRQESDAYLKKLRNEASVERN